MSIVMKEKKILNGMIESVEYITKLLNEDKATAIEMIKNAEDLPEHPEEYLEIEILSLLEVELANSLKAEEIEIE